MKRFWVAVGIGIGAAVLLAPFTDTASQLKLRRFWRRFWPLLYRAGAAAQLNRNLAPESEHTAYGEQRVTDDPMHLLNTISREDLLNVHGIGPVLADRIISGRPYSSLRELRDRKILPQGAFEELRRTLGGNQRRSA